MTARPFFRILGICLLLLGAARAEAAPITWLWEGPVTGYQCLSGNPCSADLNTVVPLGTSVQVSVTFNSDFPTFPNPSLPCLVGTASVSMSLLGQTYGSGGYVWDEAHGFGPGTCVPGYDFIEVVVPGWGSSGAALADGWIPFSLFSLDGLWWSGDLTSEQPDRIGTQLPAFHRIRQSSPQRFTADLRAVPEQPVPVPEPSTLLLFGTGLAAAARRKFTQTRRRK